MSVKRLRLTIRLAVRYLYADSEPFQYDHNFLETFRGFMECACQVISEVDIIEELEKTIRSSGRNAQADEESIDGFARDMQRAITTAKFGNNPFVAELANNLESSLSGLVLQMKSARKSNLSSDRGSAEARIKMARGNIRAAMEKFFINSHQRVEESFFHAELSGTSYVTAVEQTLEDGLSVTYDIDTSNSKLDHPIKVSELVGDLDLQIGMKKKWISRDMTREIARVTDYVVHEIRLSRTQADVRLKRKIEQATPNLILLINKNAKGEVVAEILRDDGSTNGFFAVPRDAGKLQDLWTGLREESVRVQKQKRSIRALVIDGNDVFETMSEEEVIDRLTQRFVPVVNEIARRSPSPNEYSLKLQHPDGKREELYLQKDIIGELVGKARNSRSEAFANLDVIPVIEMVQDDIS